MVFGQVCSFYQNITFLSQQSGIHMDLGGWSGTSLKQYGMEYVKYPFDSSGWWPLCAKQWWNYHIMLQFGFCEVPSSFHVTLLMLCILNMWQLLLFFQIASAKKWHINNSIHNYTTKQLAGTFQSIKVSEQMMHFRKRRLSFTHLLFYLMLVVLEWRECLFLCSNVYSNVFYIYLRVFIICCYYSITNV